jgi:hypothetical protein
LLLTGCSDPGDTRSQVAKDRTTARLAKAEAQPTGLAATMIGRWATDRTCSDAVVYAADGSLGLPAEPSGTPRTARWSAGGGRITWAGPAGTSTFRVTRIDANSHTASWRDGRRERYVRC